VIPIAASTLSVAAAPARPQPATGAISGTVSDPSGALVPGARITVINQSSGMSGEALSNDSGAFSITALTPAIYTMTAVADGFQRSVGTAIPVQAGNNTQVQPRLLLMGASAVVSVVVSALPDSCLRLLGTTKADGTTYTRADCFELNAVEQNAPPRVAPTPPPDGIVIVGMSPLALVSSQTPETNGQRLRIGGYVQGGNLVYHPNPAYPPEARRIGLQGKVVLTATIDKDGTVQSLRVIDSSNPLLNPATIDAIQNWRYKPTLLNNEPVEIPLTITVNFEMSL